MELLILLLVLSVIVILVLLGYIWILRTELLERRRHIEYLLEQRSYDMHPEENDNHLFMII